MPQPSARVGCTGKWPLEEALIGCVASTIRPSNGSASCKH